MSKPAVAKDIVIDLNGEDRNLRLRFSAWESLGVNPMDAKSLSSFLDNMSPEKAARLVQAGLAHEYRANGMRAGQTPWTVEELLDLIDVPMYVALTEEIMRAFGFEKKDAVLSTSPSFGKPNGLAAADPQTA